MTFLSTIEDDAKAVGTSIKGIFTGLRSELTSFLSASADAIAADVEAQAPKIENDIGTFIQTSAVAAVTAAELTPGGGQAKMVAALATLGAALTTKGLSLAETEMRSLLENALIATKASSTGAAHVGGA